MKIELITGRVIEVKDSISEIDEVTTLYTEGFIGFTQLLEVIDLNEEANYRTVEKPIRINLRNIVSYE